MPAESKHLCKSCRNANQKSFGGEVAIHFPGLEGLSKSIVWLFPKCYVCLSCGFTEFFVPERELRVLVEDKRVEGVLVLDENLAPDNAAAA